MGITGPHFSEAELACHHGINGCTQALVDAAEGLRDALANDWAKKFRRADEALCDAFKRCPGMRVNDAFRCPKCNGLLKNAATHSQHLLGNAMDFEVEGMTGAELEAAARRIPTIRGIGRSDHSNYLHIDVRPALVLVAWCYDAAGKEILYYAPRENDGDHGRIDS